MVMEFASSSSSSCFAAGVAFGVVARGDGVNGDLLGVVVPASSVRRDVTGESGDAVWKPEDGEAG
jgi:hypothetical protein